MTLPVPMVFLSIRCSIELIGHFCLAIISGCIVSFEVIDARVWNISTAVGTIASITKKLLLKQSYPNESKLLSGTAYLS